MVPVINLRIEHLLDWIDDSGTAHHSAVDVVFKNVACGEPAKCPFAFCPAIAFRGQPLVAPGYAQQQLDLLLVEE